MSRCTQTRERKENHKVTKRTKITQSILERSYNIRDELGDMKIYTKTGDTGQTGLFRGPRVSKHDPRVVAYGNVDELNALLGVTRNHLQNATIQDLLLKIQNELFDLGADLATPKQETGDEQLRIKSEMIEKLEVCIDQYEPELKPLQNFILPAGSIGSTYLHYARTVCRRGERSVSLLMETQDLNPEILKYLNRLSDLLFVLARVENQTTGTPDIPWKKTSQ